MSELRLLWETAREQANPLSLFDILLVAVAIYYLLRLLRGTRAMQVLKGLVVLGALVLCTRLLGLATLHWLLVQTLLPGVIALVIIFQPELRLALEQMGRGGFWTPSLQSLEREEITRLVGELVGAARYFSQNRVGALIALERQVGLNDIIQTGRAINGLVSDELLRTIFFPGTPLHDLAVVIRGNRVVAAGCLLPLTERQDIAVSLGTRHRAALGLSELTDALVLMVSEETGAISLAMDGKLFSNLTPEALQQRLFSILAPPDREGFLRLRRRDRVA